MLAIVVDLIYFKMTYINNQNQKMHNHWYNSIQSEFATIIHYIVYDSSLFVMFTILVEV